VEGRKFNTDVPPLGKAPLSHLCIYCNSSFPMPVIPKMVPWNLIKVFICDLYKDAVTSTDCMVGVAN
jgi:hypothetical protein